MKANPTAYDLLLAYAECVDQWADEGFALDWPRTRAIMEGHGYVHTPTSVPLQWMNDLRRRALDAARKEAEDERSTGQ